jgi:hypothetical protein
MILETPAMKARQKYILSINMYAHEGSGFSADHHETFDTLAEAKAAADNLIKTQRWCNVITRDAKSNETIQYRARKSESMRDAMQNLVAWVWSRAEANGFGTDDHHILFHEAAAEFGLYDAGPDGEPSAPIWLSRVVAWVLQDRSEGMTAKEGGV